MARIRTAKLSSTRAMVTDVIQISGQRMQYSSASDQLGLPQVCGLTSLRSANQVQASGTAHVNISAAQVSKGRSRFHAEIADLAREYELQIPVMTGRCGAHILVGYVCVLRL